MTLSKVNTVTINNKYFLECLEERNQFAGVDYGKGWWKPNIFALKTDKADIDPVKYTRVK